MLWYSQVVFRWRTAASIVWLLLLTIPVLLVFQILSSCSLLHPFTWITGCINDLFSLKTAIILLLYLLQLLVVSLIYSYTYTVRLPVYKTRLSIIWSVLQPTHFFVTSLFALIGGGCGYCLAELAGYQSLWNSCYGSHRCLNEYQLFCTIYGIFSGFLYGVNYYVKKEFFLVFPSIQQNKLFRLRGHMTSHLWEGLLWNFKILKYYYLLYYFFGHFLRSRLMHYLHLYPKEGAISLSTLSGLMDLGLLIHLLLAGTLLHASWTFGLRLFRTFHTEALKFPVVATFSGEVLKLLTLALKSNTSDIVTYLGFLDLYLLSIHSTQRRKKVYSLNQSGEPQVWNDVHTASLSLINSMTSRLSVKKQLNGLAGVGAAAAAGVAGSSGSGAGLFGSSTSPHSDVPKHSLSPPPLSQKGWSSLPSGYYSPPGVTRRLVNDEKARLWSYSPGVEGVGRSPPQALRKPQPSVTEEVRKRWTATKSRVRSIPHSIAERLKKKPFFTHFLSELPDTINQDLFADSQLQVWAIVGLSELVSASYAEDSYGVVQRTLPTILASLIDLSQALDKHVKSPLSSSRSTRNVRIAVETNGRYAIKTALQTSLHRLGITFMRERRALQLSDDHLQYWNSFLGIEVRH